MDFIYDHLAIPVKQKQEGMIYFAENKMWCTDYKKHPYRLQWVFFEKESQLPALIQTVSHICFVVKDIEKAILGKKILIKPKRVDGYQIAFIEEGGVPVEFVQQ